MQTANAVQGSNFPLRANAAVCPAMGGFSVPPGPRFPAFAAPEAERSGPERKNYDSQFSNYDSQFSNYDLQFSNYDLQFSKYDLQFSHYDLQFENRGS
ncbi:MAG: hypothetical protein LBJ24_02395 [Treponema sp.]|nr:hypothetical protein [Treponema sp.]